MKSGETCTEDLRKMLVTMEVIYLYNWYFIATDATEEQLK